MISSSYIQTPFTISQNQVIPSSYGFAYNNNNNGIVTGYGGGGNNELIPNPEYKSMKHITIFSYIVVMISAPIICISYYFVYESIAPYVNLEEAGNGWTFTLLFVTTGVAFALSLAIVLIPKCTRISLRWKYVFMCDMLLTLFMFRMLMVFTGAVETQTDRSDCYKPEVACAKNKAPIVSTVFGNYVQKYCGKDSTIINQPSSLGNIIEIYKMHQEGLGEELHLDSEKCAKTKELKKAIYCMYVWACILIFVIIADQYFGLGSWRLRGVPEFKNW